MTISYTNLSTALARTKERSGATSADDTYLTELLQMSAGVDASSTTHYRPFYAAARWIEQDQGQQALSDAKNGVKFTGLAKPIASLMALQVAYDLANALTVPDGFQATIAGVIRPFPLVGSRSVEFRTLP